MPLENHNKPLAAKGLKSYRYRLDFGWVMIGAINDSEALGQAYLSISPRAVSIDRLEVWEDGRYVPVSEESPS